MADDSSAADPADPGAKYDAMRAKEQAASDRRRQSGEGSAQGWTATGTILSGIIVWGLIGWGLKAWTGWIGFLPIGVLLGAALGIYLVTKQAGNPPPLMDISKAQDGGASLRRRQSQASPDGDSTAD